MPTSPAMIRRAYIASALAVAVTASIALGGSAIAQTPVTAEIRFEGGAAALGVGFSWGGGSVIYDGKTYPVKVSALSALDIGLSKYSASGTVKGLKAIRDIEGAYVVGEVGATVAGGASVQSMKNDKGVVVTFNTTRAGLQFTLAPKGVVIKLK